MWAFDLVKTTMKPLYDAAYGDDPDMEAEFGWKEKDKKEEMWSDHAWYLLARYQLYFLKMLFRIPTPPLLELRRARLLHSPIFAMTWTMMTRSPLFSSMRTFQLSVHKVVYCYEIQVEKGYRRKGLGRFMMKVW